MKHFLIKTLIFALVAGGYFQYKSYRLTRHDRYKSRVLGSEVYFSIDKSRKKHKARKVLLGDSVGKQLFDNTEENDTVNSLACNQAISLAGQYILLNNYIKAGNVVDTVYIFYLPFTFSNNLDQIFTYNYFIKPFYRDEYKPLLFPAARKAIDKVPFTGISQFAAVLTSDWSPEYKVEEDRKTFLSPISIEYLHKIVDLSKRKHFKIKLVSGPISYNKEALVEAFDKKEISRNGFDDLFEGYFESIIYLDESNFLDGTHLIHPEKFKNRYKNLIR